MHSRKGAVAGCGKEIIHAIIGRARRKDKKCLTVEYADDDGQYLVHALFVGDLRVFLGVDEEDGGHHVFVVVANEQ